MPVKRVNKWSFVLDPDVGERGIPTRCAFTVDIRDRYPHLKVPHVDKKTIAFTDRHFDERLVWRTPEAVKDWIDAYDNEQAPPPHAVILLRAKAKVLGSERHATADATPTVDPKTAGPAAPNPKTPVDPGHRSRKIRRR